MIPNLLKVAQDEKDAKLKTTGVAFRIPPGDWAHYWLTFYT